MHSQGRADTRTVGTTLPDTLSRLDRASFPRPLSSDRAARSSCIILCWMSKVFGTMAMGDSQPGIQRDGDRLLARHSPGQRLDRAVEIAQREAVRMHLLERVLVRFDE